MRNDSVLPGFDPATQHFSDAPSLGDATAGHVRFPGVEYFGDRPDAVIAEMDRERFQKFSRSLIVPRMNFQPGINERADEPGPDRALMISAVARAQVAAINRLVFRIVR